jgi:hypothetical protein
VSALRHFTPTPVQRFPSLETCRRVALDVLDPGSQRRHLLAAGRCCFPQRPGTSVEPGEFGAALGSRTAHERERLGVPGEPCLEAFEPLEG